MLEGATTVWICSSFSLPLQFECKGPSRLNYILLNSQSETTVAHNNLLIIVIRYIKVLFRQTNKLRLRAWIELPLVFLYISSRFFENQPNEICSHLSEKALKSTFLKPEKLQKHSNERKGKEKKKEQGEGKKEEKKKQWFSGLLVFIIATLEIGKTVRRRFSIWR